MKEKQTDHASRPPTNGHAGRPHGAIMQRGLSIRRGCRRLLLLLLVYFFFSLWSVCLRSRGEYFLILSFSPPDLRRSV